MEARVDVTIGDRKWTTASGLSRISLESAGARLRTAEPLSRRRSIECAASCGEMLCGGIRSVLCAVGVWTRSSFGGQAVDY